MPDENRISKTNRQHGCRRTLVAVACCLVLPAAGRAQTPEQQVVNDAAAALGGRDKILAVKTMLLEGAGSQVAGTSLLVATIPRLCVSHQPASRCEARVHLGRTAAPGSRRRAWRNTRSTSQCSRSSDTGARRDGCLQRGSERNPRASSATRRTRGAWTTFVIRSRSFVPRLG